MGLREFKQSSGFLLPDARGAWCHFHEGELARCPYPDCRRAWMKVANGRVVSTRPPLSDDNPSVIGVITCRECRRSFHVATPETTPKPLQLE